MWRPISEAPRGGVRKVDVGRGGQRDIFVPDRVLAPASNDEIIMTWWLPDVERWNFFTKDAPPEVWWDFGDGRGMPLSPSKEAQG